MNPEGTGSSRYKTERNGLRSKARRGVVPRGSEEQTDGFDEASPETEA
jgi:hypothetical protein